LRITVAAAIATTTVTAQMVHCSRARSGKVARRHRATKPTAAALAHAIDSTTSSIDGSAGRCVNTNAPMATAAV
jgi:hypothetical protein